MLKTIATNEGMLKVIQWRFKIIRIYDYIEAIDTSGTKSLRSFYFI